MKTITSVSLALVLSLWPLSIHADIFVWTDPQGMKRITNLNPPEYAEIMRQTGEIGSNRTPDDGSGITDDQKIRHRTHKENQRTPPKASEPEGPQHDASKRKPIQAG